VRLIVGDCGLPVCCSCWWGEVVGVWREGCPSADFKKGREEETKAKGESFNGLFIALSGKEGEAGEVGRAQRKVPGICRRGDQPQEFEKSRGQFSRLGGSKGGRNRKGVPLRGRQPGVSSSIPGGRKRAMLIESVRGAGSEEWGSGFFKTPRGRPSSCLGKGKLSTPGKESDSRLDRGGGGNWSGWTPRGGEWLRRLGAATQMRTIGRLSAGRLEVLGGRLSGHEEPVERLLAANYARKSSSREKKI